MSMKSNEKIVVVGLGYVGLPVALAFARKYEDVVGFDISERRIDELKQGVDRTHEVDPAELKRSTIRFTADPEVVKGGTFFVVTVPTPIDGNRQPDLTPVIKASETVGKLIEPGAVVVYESTVYPGVTEEVCAPILARISGLAREQFKLGYSPERINPGDKHHTLETTIKVVSGEDAETLERVATAYEAIVPAGVHRAPTIKVAEAAKVIENTQRDLNIALMNELAIIFGRLGIDTSDVLAAAYTAAMPDSAPAAAKEAVNVAMDSGDPALVLAGESAFLSAMSIGSLVGAVFAAVAALAALTLLPRQHVREDSPMPTV